MEEPSHSKRESWQNRQMVPHASVSGLMFAHPAAHYFNLGKIDETQLRDYAHRRGIPCRTDAPLFVWLLDVRWWLLDVRRWHVTS